jgi:hypothetical protein
MQAPFKPDREPNNLPSAPISRDELRYRLRQQSQLGEFGLSLSETQSCWQLISNRAMLLPYARGL